MNNNSHSIKSLKFRDLPDYLFLRNSCFCENPVDAPKAEPLLAERAFFILNKFSRYFLPIFRHRYNIYAYYIDDRVIGFHHLSQRHPLWPYSLIGSTEKMYTELFATQHSRRGKGIGKKLYSYILEHYSDYDIFDIVHVKNKASIRIGKSVGMQTYDQATKYTLRLPNVEYQNTQFRKPFSIRNNPSQINQLYELYKRSLSPEAFRVEKPLMDYFKVSPLYLSNLYLLILSRLYNECRYGCLSDSQSQIKIFIHLRNNLKTRGTEMVMIASEKSSDLDLVWVKGMIYSLARAGQKDIVTYARKNQINIQDALKALNFTQEGEYLCRVREAQ